MDIVGPCPLKPLQGLADFLDLRVIDVFAEGRRISFFEDFYLGHHGARLVRQLHCHRALVMRRALLGQIPHVGHFFDVVRHVRALVIAAFNQIADRHGFVADVGEQESLDAVQVPHPQPVQLCPNNIKKPPVQAFNQAGQFQVTSGHVDLLIQYRYNLSLRWRQPNRASARPCNTATNEPLTCHPPSMAPCFRPVYSRPMQSIFPHHCILPSVRPFIRRICRFTVLIVAGVMIGACAADKVPTAGEIKSENADNRARQLIRVGDASRAGGDAASALAFYQRAVKQRPDWPTAYQRIGETALSLGLAEQAAESYSKLAELAPNDIDARLGLGKTLIALDRPAEAAKTFEQARTLAPSDYRAYNGLGVAADLIGDHAAAAGHYQTGLALAPDNLSLQGNLGLSLALAGNFKDAIEILGDAAKTPAAGPRIRQNLALVYGLSGDVTRAAQVGRLDLSEAAVQSNLRRYATLRRLSAVARARAVHGQPDADGVIPSK